MDKKLGPYFRTLRESRNMTQEEVAQYCGQTKGNVSMWENNRSTPKYETLVKLQKLYGVSFDELMTGNLSKRVQKTRDIYRVPLISWTDIHDKESIDVCDMSHDVYIPTIKRASDRAFALQVKGHSMEAPSGRSYAEGSYIICEPDLSGSAVSGQRVIARLSDGHITFKELVDEDGRKWLKSLNPDYPPIHDDFVILAVVTDSNNPE